MIGPGKAVSKASGPSNSEIPEIALGRSRGSKPQMVGMTRVPFWINLGDDSGITGYVKTKGAKPSMAGMVCPFFGASAPKSIGDSIIFSMATKVRGAGGIL